jgi:hypothetical protein
VVRTRLQVEQALVGVNYKFNWGRIGYREVLIEAS